MKFKMLMSSILNEHAKAGLAVMVFAASATLPIAASEVRAEFVKYYRQITGKDAPEGMVNFAIDPKISKSGRDAYAITSGWRASSPALAKTASVQQQVVTITGSNLRSVWYGLYDLLERRGGCHWFWDGDVVPKKESLDLSNLDVHEEAHFEYRAIRTADARAAAGGAVRPVPCPP